MKTSRFALFATALAVSFAVATAQTAAPVAKPDASAASEKKDTGRFRQMHQSFLARGKAGPIGVLFLGDSITQGWSKAPHVWEHYFGKW